MTVNRKPDNGAEIQNDACDQSGIIVRLVIVKSASNEIYQEDYEYNPPHGTKVLK